MSRTVRVGGNAFAGAGGDLQVLGKVPESLVWREMGCRDGGRGRGWLTSRRSRGVGGDCGEERVEGMAAGRA